MNEERRKLIEKLRATVNSGDQGMMHLCTTAAGEIKELDLEIKELNEENDRLKKQVKELSNIEIYCNEVLETRIDKLKRQGKLEEESSSAKGFKTDELEEEINSLRDLIKDLREGNEKYKNAAENAPLDCDCVFQKDGKSGQLFAPCNTCKIINDCPFK